MRFLKNTNIISFAFTIILLSCSNPTENNFSNAYYFNSFETESDLINWQGVTLQERRSDAAPNCGKYSLYVSGGCVVPHAYYTLPELEKDIRFVLKCWGKGLGGTASVRNPSNNKQITVYLGGNEWKQFESKDTLFCQKGDRISIELISGGLIISNMLVDGLELIGVK
jgi:hypothetical protein